MKVEVEEEVEEMASISGSKDVIDETSPDLLKNTPSNIRRLADEIEHLEGRQKYLAQTRSPSDGGDLRWYFCKMPLAVNRMFYSNCESILVSRWHSYLQTSLIVV